MKNDIFDLCLKIVRKTIGFDLQKLDTPSWEEVGGNYFTNKDGTSTCVGNPYRPIYKYGYRFLPKGLMFHPDIITGIYICEKKHYGKLLGFIPLGEKNGHDFWKDLQSKKSKITKREIEKYLDKN